MSALMHSGDMVASGRRVLLVEGPLSLEAMRFLSCVASEVHCPVELQYRVAPSVITEGQQRAAGAGGE